MPDNKEQLEKYVLHSKIWQGKKKTYLDQELKIKQFVPNKFYEVGLNILPKGNSNLGKAKRKLMGDDILEYQKKNKVPGPNAFSPDKGAIIKKELACVDQRSPRTSYLDQAIYHGESNPDFHSKNYDSVDKKTRSPVIKNKINEDYDVATFLKQTLASKDVSPAHYDPMDAYH